jgi:hypothetical protein
MSDKKVSYSCEILFNFFKSIKWNPGNLSISKI